MGNAGRSILRLVLLGPCLLALCGASGPAGERIALMKEMSGILRLLGSVANGLLPVDGEVARGAATLHTDSVRLGGLFPPGSADAEGRALDRIWTERATFDADMAAFQQAAASMAGAVEAGDLAAIRPAYAALARACLQCHDSFRRP
ncbi:c-type cytochrome [Zavarzinia sp. CC-PAN008]|uniref:c-type cytochrome n=1 Tax=Zavarzinia sp. CC-PAN008 TaxID=3243332 RepID=UPI003F74AC3D